jgi:hypothetical protein
MTRDNEMDLRVLPGATVQNQIGHSGERYLVKVDGILEEFYYDEDHFIGRRLSQKLMAEWGWFEKIVRHSPSVGTFYEDALKGILREVVPKSYNIGTGFVFDPIKKTHSKQIDVLIYKNSERAPYYQSGEFAVVAPTEVAIVSEVKKTLTLKDIRNLVKNFAFFPIGPRSFTPIGCQYYSVFCYQSKLKTERIIDEVYATLRRLTDEFRSETVDGHKVEFGIYTLNLPQFYFLDRGDYLTTRFVRSKDCRFDIEISKDTSALTDSLNEYLSRVIDKVGGDFGINDRDFLSSSIRNCHPPRKIIKDLFLVNKVTLREIIKKFPESKNELLSLRSQSGSPYAVILPSTISLQEISSLKELLSIERAQWLCFDEDQQISEDKRA